MNLQIITLGKVAIPVGHRVEIVHYQLVKMSTGLFSSGKRQTEEVAEPLITDLDTGIRYGHASHYHNSWSTKIDDVNLSKHDLLPGLVVLKKITGTVRSCSVVRFSEHEETELCIQPD